MKVGDIVCLKVGGPEMVISEIVNGDDNHFVVCVWWCSVKNEPRSNAFRELVLIACPK